MLTFVPFLINPLLHCLIGYAVHPFLYYQSRFPGGLVALITGGSSRMIKRCCPVKWVLRRRERVSKASGKAAVLCVIQSSGHLCNVIMATDRPQRVLAYKVESRLSESSAGQLLKVGSTIHDSSLTCLLTTSEVKSGKPLRMEVWHSSSSSLTTWWMIWWPWITARRHFERRKILQLFHECAPPHRDFHQPARSPDSLTTYFPRHQSHVNRDVHGDPSMVNKHLHTPPSLVWRQSMPPRNPATLGSAEPLTKSFAGRVSLYSSIGDQIIMSQLCSQLSLYALPRVK